MALSPDEYCVYDPQFAEGHASSVQDISPPDFVFALPVTSTLVSR